MVTDAACPLSQQVPVRNMQKQNITNIAEYIREYSYIIAEAWQDVLEGQAIPPGLHVQIDMHTGTIPTFHLPRQSFSKSRLIRIGRKQARLMAESEHSGVHTLSEKRNHKLAHVAAALNNRAHEPEVPTFTINNHMLTRSRTRLSHRLAMRCECQCYACAL